MIQQAVRTILVTNADVAALVGDRVSPLRETQGAALPFITYRLVDVESIDVHSGDTDYEKVTVEVEVWAESYKEAQAISKKVKIALAYYKGSVGGSDVRAILPQGSTEINEQPIEGAGDPIYRLSQDFSILHKDS